MRRSHDPDDPPGSVQGTRLPDVKFEDQSGAMDFGSTNKENDDEKPFLSPKRRRVRHACIPCRQKKIKCDGNYPCGYCVKFQRECTMPFRPTMPSKPRAIAPTGPQVSYPTFVDPSSVAISPLTEHHERTDFKDATTALSLPREIRVLAETFGAPEMRYVDVYLKLCHSYIPVVSQLQLKEALRRNKTPLQLLTRTEQARTSAYLAVAWAVAAIGASFYDREGAMRCLQNALEHIRACFDNPMEETINAYLAVCEAYYRLDVQDTRAWTKYIGFAHVLETELSGQLTPEVQALFDYYQTLVKNNTASPSNRIEYTTRHAFVETKKSLPAHVQELDLMTLCIQHIANIVKGINLNPYELRRQTELFLTPLTALYERLSVSGDREKAPLRFLVVCMFYIYFQIKLGKIPAAVPHFSVLTPMFLVVPIHLWPRVKRVPFLLLRVLELLQCWTLAADLRRALDAAGVRWDGLVDQNKVDELMWVDMYNDIVAFQKTQQQSEIGPRIFEIPADHHVAPQDINTRGVFVENEDDSSGSFGYEHIAPNEFEFLNAFFAEGDISTLFSDNS